jgi:hypothetical protein
MEHDLEQQIAQFFLKVSRFAGLVGLLNGVKRLVRLLEQVRGERSVGLLVVPGAAARGPQPGHDSDKFIKGLRHTG